MAFCETNSSGAELFVDGKALERIVGGAALRLHAPELKEIAVTCEKPWEWLLGYPSVVPDGAGGWFLYYRGMGNSRDYRVDEGHLQVTCVCRSPDGIHFSRASTGREWEGHTDTNIVWSGAASHNFTPFYDTNPACPPSQRFKAVGGVHQNERHKVGDAFGCGGLFALASADGIHWQPLSETPVVTAEGFSFDSQNVAFYDAALGKYRLYSRYWHGPDREYRAIQGSVSDDFLHWGAPVPNDYGEEVAEHFYTNAACPCPGAEHILLSFPNRFMEERKRVRAHDEAGVSDTVFMAGRDGVRWARLFKEAWLRPGLDDANWTDRNMMVGSGIAETPDGFSVYCTEHNYLDHRIRRAVIRRHGFVSLSAGWEPGIGVTKAFVYGGGKLRLNFSTSAAGHVKAWLVDAAGEAPSAAPEGAFELFGDALDEAYPIRKSKKFVGKPVRLCFELKDADVFSYKFAM
ncbi:MAG: hypothetical protein LBB75_06780 [Oscillospiraceae bacterium]|jgi:hypothetical protein|nr:hypothetical protein [Oscillospiraceae bacterium]